MKSMKRWATVSTRSTKREARRRVTDGLSQLSANEEVFQSVIDVLSLHLPNECVIDGMDLSN